MTSGVERDVQCGADFSRLADLGCFDEEFLVFGCAFQENQRIKYFISSKEDKIYQFANEGTVKDIDVMPVISKIKRCSVASGEREIIRQEVKLELVRELKQTYSRDYFNHFTQLAKTPACDYAYQLLKQQQKQLVGGFEADKLLLFAGLCQQALESKVLTRQSYGEFSNWLQDVYKQMEDDIIIKDKFNRHFLGFAYEKSDGNSGYYFDANATNVWRKKLSFQEQGIFTTPILEKSYWFGALNQLSQIREEFKTALVAQIDADYVALSREIKNFPSVIDNVLYLEILNYVHNNCSAKAYQALCAYGYRWNVSGR